MGVQALRLVVPLAKKDDIVFSTPVTALVVAPGANSIAVITMLGAGDLHRHLETQLKIKECINFLLEGNFLPAAALDAFVAMKLNESKPSIRTSAVFTEFVTGDVGISIDAALRTPGAKNWIYNAFIQTLDFMNEKDRLSV